MSTISIESDDVISVVKPSQWVNMGWFISPFIALYGFDFFIISIVLFIIFIWKVIVIECWRYELGERTISEVRGVLNVKIDEIHYFRVKNIQLSKPFLLRIAGLSNVIIITSDPVKPKLILRAIPNGDEVRSMLKDTVYEWRTKQNVREYDVT